MAGDLVRQQAAWEAALSSGDVGRITTTARRLTELKSKVDTDFQFTVCDRMWTPVAPIGSDLIRGKGNDPRNKAPQAMLQVKGNSDLVDLFMQCRNTLVGVELETAGQRYNFYVKTHRYKYDDSAWTGNVELRGIWDILNYYVIWPSWYLPIQAQPISHAVFLWALQTCLENMVAECALRLQSGIWEFVNNVGSLNPDVKAWFGTMLQALERDGLTIDTFRRLLKTPTYVSRTNPFLDGSPAYGRTVRMETVGKVIGEATQPYGVDTRMDLWRPGDPQPDRWANLDQPTYVFSTKDRSQIEGPTKTVLDSVLRTVVDLGGSLGGILDPLVTEIPGMSGVYQSPLLGVHFEQPYAIMIAPEDGEDGAITSCEVADHTPEGWQHIIGGRSPKWAGAPRLTAGGHRPTGLPLTQRFDERHVRLGDRQHFHRDRILRYPKRSAVGLPQQRVLRISAHRALRPPQRHGSLPPGDRAVLSDGERAVQHRNRIRLYQCGF